MDNEQAVFDAPIVAITVFADCARITRRGVRPLTAGEHTLVLPRLPALLEEDSVRINARGPGIRLRTVTVAREERPQPGDGADCPQPYLLRITVDAEAAAELQLQIRYIVSGVSWEPGYAIHLLGDQAHMTYYAAVRQQSGEDWPPAELLLSTGRPLVRATLPKLAPWYVDGSPAEAPAAGTADAAPPDAGTGGDSVPGTPINYPAQDSIPVPADGSINRATIAAFVFDAQLDYLAVPKLAEEVFRRARIKNTSAYMLLPGRAQIYYESDFAGATALQPVAPAESFDLQLGVDEEIGVARELATLGGGKSVITGTLRRTQFACQITLTNRQDRPAIITVNDQLPVARQDNIKIRLLDAIPRPTEHDRLNLLQWIVQLGPRETREITFTYTVEQPRTL